METTTKIMPFLRIRLTVEVFRWLHFENIITEFLWRVIIDGFKIASDVPTLLLKNSTC